MVRLARPLALLATLATGLVSTLSAREWPDYQVGDTAKADVVTPIQLIVIDPDETAALKQREALKVPVLCRYNTNAVEEVEKEFRSAFANSRSNFLVRLETVFQRQNLGEKALATPRFQRFLGQIQRPNKFFPVTTNLAELWAQGQSDHLVEASLAGALRGAMNRPLRATAPPAELKLTLNLRLVPVAHWNEALSLETAEQRAVNCSRTNVILLGRAREEFIQWFPPEEQRLAKFLSSLLRTNFSADVELTRQARARRTDPLWAADRYEAGQTIVKQGQMLDKKLKAALAQLKEKTAVAGLQQQLREDELKAQQAEFRNRCLLASLAALAAMLFAIIWRLTRRAPAGSLLPARIDGAAATVVSCPACAEKIIVPGEGSPEAAPTDLRARLLPHLARLLKDKLVQKLLSQRTELLETQKKAAIEMAELEARLAKIHAPLQERLRAYEQRIGELEKELTQKGAENCALIQLKIQMVRSQLAATRDKLTFN